MTTELTTTATARDVLRQIIQSQMWISPFRHTPSYKTLRNHSNLLSQINFEQEQVLTSSRRSNRRNRNRSYEINEMKQESDDEEDENSDDSEDEDDDEFLSNDWMELINLDSEFNELYNILYSTMKGEGNTSVLLFGRNGFGKSALLSSVMHKIEKKCKNQFIYIYLNANLHTTDVESLYEIVSQLAHQNGRKFNFTLFDYDQEMERSVSLESDEMDNIGQDKEVKLKRADFVDNLEYLVSELKKVTMENYEINNRKNRKPIYIVLDNFELFAKRHKQTLLYNLFDLNQSQSSLLNIIGITNKKSVYETLEKRIRSRFVHKKIFVPQKSFLSKNQFKLFFKIIYNVLYIKDYRKYFIPSQSSQTDTNDNIKKLIIRYNHWIEKGLLTNKDFESYLKRLHRFGCSPSRFLVISGKISSMLFTEKYFMKRLNKKDIQYIIQETEDELFEDPFLRMIHNLSLNELIILIVAAKYDKAKGQPFNFEIIYQILKDLKNKDAMMIVMDKHIYFQSYRQLINMNFLVPLSNVNKIININTSSSSKDMLTKIFHSNFDMVRLNKLIDSGHDILTYISKNIKNLPVWINSWLLNNKTHICL